MPAVSVIIASYNRAAMVGQAIRSVLAQTYGDWELIVVDDGSTDETAAVIARLTEARLRYVRQENRGLAAARNVGIRQARGRYVAFLDSDDLFLPNKLRAQTRQLDHDPALGLVAGGYVEVDEQLRVLREMQPWRIQRTLDFKDWLCGCPVCPSVPLVRRSWLDRAGLFDESMRFVEDWDLWLRLSQLGCRMAWIEEPVCAYRIHGGNMVRDAHRMKAGMLAMLDKLYAHAGLPADVLAARDQAYAYVYLDAAARAYAMDLVTDAKAWLGMATDLHPALLQGTPPRLLDSLASFALSALVDDAAAFMESVVRNLPERADMPRWSNRQAHALVHAVRAFDSNRRHHHLTAAGHAIAAVLRDRAWFRNRGVRAIIGSALWRQARALARRRSDWKSYGSIGRWLDTDGPPGETAGSAPRMPIGPHQ